jgi:hypothetical protein
MNTHHYQSYFTATGHYAKAHAKSFNERQMHQIRFFFISNIILMIAVLFFALNADAQTGKNLAMAKSEQKINSKTIGQKEKVDRTQEKQSGNLFEYVSVAAASSQSGMVQPFIFETLPVVFTSVETLPVLAGSHAAWSKLLIAHGASAVDEKTKMDNNTVLVSYLVDATGKMYDVQILAASNQDLNQRAIALMKATGTSKPAFTQGQVVAYRGEIVLHFF